MHVRSYLDRFLFRHEQAETYVGKLSGGEQARLLLAMLMLQPTNLLILDEPTNDLDVDTLEVLRATLVDFPGALILVSHDRMFLDEVCPRILAFPPPGSPHAGELVPFAGIEQWEAWYEAELQLAKNPRPVVAAPAPTVGASTKSRKLSFKEQRELETMEETIGKAETELVSVQTEIAAPETAMKPSRLRELTTRMTELQTQIERLYSRWSELSGE
jgi:ATP-binding cassette subfamily F protein uup